MSNKKQQALLNNIEVTEKKRFQIEVDAAAYDELLAQLEVFNALQPKNSKKMTVTKYINLSLPNLIKELVKINASLKDK